MKVTSFCTIFVALVLSVVINNVIGESIELANNRTTNKPTFKKLITNKTMKAKDDENKFYLQPKIGIFTNGNRLTAERVKLLLNDGVEFENKTLVSNQTKMKVVYDKNAPEYSESIDDEDEHRHIYNTDIQQQQQQQQQPAGGPIAGLLRAMKTLKSLFDSENRRNLADFGQILSGSNTIAPTTDDGTNLYNSKNSKSDSMSSTIATATNRKASPTPRELLNLFASQINGFPSQSEIESYLKAAKNNQFTMIVKKVPKMN